MFVCHSFVACSSLAREKSLLVQKITITKLLVQSAPESQALFSLYINIGCTNIIKRLKSHISSVNQSCSSCIKLGFLKTMKIKVHIIVLIYACIS